MTSTPYEQDSRDIIEHYVQAIRNEQHRRKLNHNDLSKLLRISDQELSGMWVLVQCSLLLDWPDNTSLAWLNKSIYCTRWTCRTATPSSVTFSTELCREVDKYYSVAQVRLFIANLRTAFNRIGLHLDELCSIYHCPAPWPSAFQTRCLTPVNIQRCSLWKLDMWNRFHETWSSLCYLIPRSEQG